MKYLFGLIILFSIISLNAQEKPTIIYVGDPMCSWCYGFSPEFTKVLKNLENDVNVEWIMGGLRPYNDQKMTELKSFLAEHWEEVHDRSGQKFSYDILESDITYDTEPSCRAVVTVKEMNEDLVMDFFQAVQHAFYFKNKNPNKAETFVEIANNLGLSVEKFKSLYESEDMKQKVKQEFQLAQDLNATGFPTVILRDGEDYYLMSQGYMKANVLEQGIRELIEEL